MSYDLKIRVKAEGCEAYPTIATPEYDTPTYNLGEMFRKCMDWDYSQGEKDENGEWHDCIYKCDFVIEKVQRGINELRTNRSKYYQYEPENGWGTLDGAIRVLESLRDCIYEQSEEIPLNCLYMSW
jgi:hypothetical protein